MGVGRGSFLGRQGTLLQCTCCLAGEVVCRQPFEVACLDGVLALLEPCVALRLEVDALGLVWVGLGASGVACLDLLGQSVAHKRRFFAAPAEGAAVEGQGAISLGLGSIDHVS